MPSAIGGCTSSSAASIISSVMFVKVPVMREACLSSFSAVCRPMIPESCAARTASLLDLATSPFSLSSISHSEANLIAKLSGTLTPSLAAAAL